MRIVTHANGDQTIGTAKVSHSGRHKSTKPKRTVRRRSLATNADQKFDCRVDIECVSYRTRLVDPDNLCAKFFVDSIKEAGIIEDDSAKYVASVTYRQVKVQTRLEEKTELIITAAKE